MIANIIKSMTFAISMLVFIATEAQYKPQVLPPQVSDSMAANVSRIIFKVNSGNQVQSNQRSAVPATDVLSTIKEKLELNNSVNKVFDKESGHNMRTLGSSRLDNIYEVKVDGRKKAVSILKELKETKGVEYAEMYHQNHLFYIPNDPLANPKFGNQYHLENVAAYNAWGIEQGDSSIVIGIVDTGVDLDHTDLSGNLAFNYDDPINGVDDDNDGYVDNFMGWDVADDDNEPEAAVNGHGTSVTGMSSAHTNNNDGIAGSGFNSKYLPVKILDDGSNMLVNEYEGIVYAVDHGAKVINLSWGGAWNYSKFGKDVIDYAVLDNDVVVVAAAGNTHGEIDFYPASYDNVLSVGASTQSDELATWATYSYKMDLMAPGHNVFTTKNDNKYGNAQGSSFASPLVAGAAALVRSKFPDLDAKQVMEQLRVTADDVYDLPFNQNFEGQLGKGRLNMYKAVTDSVSPSVRIKEVTYETAYGDKIFSGDTITIYPSFINYLRPAENLTITLKSANSTTSGESVYQVNSLNTYSTFDKAKEEGWKVVVDKNVQPGTRLLFKVEFEADNYTDFEYFQLYTTPDYFDMDSKELSLTVSGDGDLGYDNGSFVYGNGIKYGDDQLASCMGIMLTKDANTVLDNVVSSYLPYAKSQDFRTEEYIRLFNNSTADIDARSTFHEYENLGNKLGVKIEQKALSWDKTGSGNYLVLEYRIVNTTDSTLNNVNMGLYVDWDIFDKLKNTAGWDDANKLAWASGNDIGTIYTGMALLSSGATSFYPLDLDNLNGNTQDFDNYFEESKKYELSTAGLTKTEAGLNGGNDIANLLAMNGIDIPSKGSKKVAFVISASADKQTLNDLIAEAKVNYEKYLGNPPVDQEYFTCKDDSVNINFENNTVKEFYVDPSLQTKLDSSFTYTTSTMSMDTSYYFVRLNDGIRSDVRTIKVKIKQPEASFEQSTDTLFIEQNGYNKVSFLNTSETTTNWFWDFGNGFQASVENPTTQYNSSGLYDVMMIATNDLGCLDTINSEIFVAVRSEKPSVTDQLICNGTSTQISASNASLIRVYDDKALNNVLFEGNTFSTGNLETDQAYYVTNIDSWESLPVKVNIKVSHPDLSFNYALDTVELTKKYLVNFENTSTYELNSEWYVNDKFSGNGKELAVDYTGLNNVEVVLTAEDSIQCRDSVIYAFEPKTSQMPADLAYKSCSNQSVSVRPANDQIYYFYSDAALTNMIHKGNTLDVEVFSNDSVLYYTAMDQYLESEPAMITVNNAGLIAKIDARPDKIDISKENEVVLTDMSDNADWSYWYRTTGTIDTSTVLVESVYEVGDYIYYLVAGTDLGCVDTAVINVKAEIITGLEDDLNGISMFPNPAVDNFKIKLDNQSFTNPLVSLVDMKGALVLNEQPSEFYQDQLTVNTANIQPGIYLVIVRDENLQFQSRISIKH